MGTFAASLKTIGDTRGLPATVELTEGKISIAAGDTAIGEWSLGDIDLEPIPTGYRVSAEGDQIILEPKDLRGFNAALEETSRKKRRLRRPKPAKPKTERPKEKSARRSKDKKDFSKLGKRDESEPTTRADLAPRPSAPAAEPAPSATEPVAKAKGPNPFLARVDAVLDAAHRKWGDLLPDWAFARGTLVALIILLALVFVFPGQASFVSIVGGLLLIVFGGVAYSDEVVAAKWLPGRTTPAHPLIGGIVIVALGVLIGVIDRL